MYRIWFLLSLVLLAVALGCHPAPGIRPDPNPGEFPAAAADQ
ncbi:hypothetical protein ACWEQ7_02925 [Streptomyces sp. NPDC004069]